MNNQKQGIANETSNLINRETPEKNDRSKLLFLNKKLIFFK